MSIPLVPVAGLAETSLFQFPAFFLNQINFAVVSMAMHRVSPAAQVSIVATLLLLRYTWPPLSHAIPFVFPMKSATPRDEFAIPGEA